MPSTGSVIREIGIGIKEFLKEENTLLHRKTNTTYHAAGECRRQSKT